MGIHHLITHDIMNDYTITIQSTPKLLTDEWSPRTTEYYSETKSHGSTNYII